MAAAFKQHLTAESGIMSKEEFLAFQTTMGDSQKVRFGHGLYFTAEESVVCYDALACLDPSYEGVKMEDLAKIGMIIEAMQNMGAE